MHPSPRATPPSRAHAVRVPHAHARRTRDAVTHVSLAPAALACGVGRARARQPAVPPRCRSRAAYDLAVA